ncbi:SH3 domain-binding glutamic acid-rich protein homolog [Achroia grisella]|uniref:SH3 domain-binding glutamic acid-rich protein homolog n=1 Tax=Achroia grisella TaxID=688607 RepID=UPI0027D26110|nr:SH3 domain-binding glutamic acid-rich protein homolog [Achroia grisella]
MVVKIYISGISGNKEVKKRQQRVLMILDSKNIKYDVIDITEPGREDDKDFMQNNAKSNGGTVSDPNPRSPLPPQVFNDEEYCGDYDQFDLANEVDTLEQFLKVEVPLQEETSQAETEKAVNGDVEEQKSKENSQERETEKSVSPKEGTPVKDKTPSREATPADGEKSKEGTPDETPQERQQSVDKESSPPKSEDEIESKKSSKENTPEKEESVNENGTVSSREQSEEKDTEEEEETESVDRKKDNPSEALIQSEQAAAAE